jgi:hypothetical protein
MKKFPIIFDNMWMIKHLHAFYFILCFIIIAKEYCFQSKTFVFVNFKEIFNKFLNYLSQIKLWIYFVCTLGKVKFTIFLLLTILQFCLYTMPPLIRKKRTFSQVFPVCEILIKEEKNVRIFF